MGFWVETRCDGSEDNPSLKRLREIVEQLKIHDPEHPDTWLVHESGWSLTADESGRLVWENRERKTEARHLTGVTRDHVFELWVKLSEGRIDEIEQAPWRPGPR